MKTATFIKTMPGSAHDVTQKLYRFDPPLPAPSYSEDKQPSEYGIVSASRAYGLVFETYIFASDNEGTITDWLERDGSMKNTVDHDTVIKNAGYEPIYGPVSARMAQAKEDE